jgi:hypothetical protein
MISDVDSDSKMYANGFFVRRFNILCLFWGQIVKCDLLGDTAQLPPVKFGY